MKLLVDMNLSPSWVKYLAEAGFESIHWSEIGSGSAPDAELMAWATEHGYVVLTADLDFGAILAATCGRSPSVVQLRSDILTPRSLGEAVVTAIKLAEQELRDGALVSVDPTRARIRILPLR
jgi:predicted nuclease of predicted toxin-antitoxin system